jgi:hypothetical protein
MENASASWLQLAKTASSKRATHRTGPTPRIDLTTPVDVEGHRMTNKSPRGILGLAAALAMLAGASSVTARPAEASIVRPMDEATGAGGDANRFVVVGNDVLSFLVTQGENGEIIAQHQSHSSHASHASHASHTSSRY